jgi:hypothetical protein
VAHVARCVCASLSLSLCLSASTCACVFMCVRVCSRVCLHAGFVRVLCFVLSRCLVMPAWMCMVVRRVRICACR